MLRQYRMPTHLTMDTRYANIVGMSKTTETAAAEPKCADCGHGTLAHNAIGGACTKCDCGHFRAESRCLRPGCGRKLTSARSIAAGYGPKCAAKIRKAQIDQARDGFTADQQAKADELIRDGGIIPVRETAHNGSLYRVVSSKGDETYLATAHGCSCMAGVRGRRCYHKLAATVLGIASKRTVAKAA
jgi:Family of unknown function (DUF6011)